MSRGILVVSLFVFSLLAFNVVAAPPASKPFGVSHTPVITGMPVTITVHSGDCEPIEVRFLVGGEVQRATVERIGGSATFNVPEHLQSKVFTFTLVCGDHAQVETGVVIESPL
jgi:hypothetical protein